MPRVVWPMQSPIGVDLAGRRVKVAQCVRGLRGASSVSVCVQAVRPVPVERSADLTTDDAALIAGLIERSGCEGRAVVLGVPTGMLLFGSLELPARGSGAPLEQIARLELARAHRVEPDSFEMAMWDVPSPARSGEGTHALAVGLQPARIEAFLCELDMQGLDVVAIDSRSLALARATAVLHASEGVTCIVDANWQGLSVILCLNGLVVVDRAVDAVAWGDVCARGAIRAGITADQVQDGLVGATAPPASIGSLRSLTTEYLDGLIPEVTRSVTYTSHRYPSAPLASVLVTGDAAGLPGLSDRLAQALSVRACVVEPGMVLGTSSAKGPMPSAATLGAIGLAMHGIGVTQRRAV